MEKTLESRAWLVPVVLAALVVFFFRPAILPDPPSAALTGGERSDIPRQFYPWLTFVVETIKAGQFPLWNPHVFGGTPLIANPQINLYYPPGALLLLVGVERGVTLLVVLHFWWAAWGMAKLARSFGASALGGLLAGVIFAFSSQLIVSLWAGHYTQVLVSSWGPWVWLAYRYALARRTSLAALPGAAALGMALLAGHPQRVIAIGMLLAGLWAYHIITSAANGERTGTAFWLATRQLGIMVVGSALLAAVMLLPVAEFIPLSVRSSGGDLAFTGEFSLPGALLLNSIVPNLLGDSASYWGPENFEELSGGFASLWGVLAALLALRLRNQRHVWFFWTVSLTGLVLSLGLGGGLMILLNRWVPLLRFFRGPARAVYFTIVALAGLSALVVTHLQTTSTDERRAFLRPAIRVWIPAVTAFLFAGAFAALLFLSQDPPIPERLWAVANAAGVSGLIMVTVGLTLRLWRDDGPRAVGWASLATVAVVVIDLWRVGLPLVVAEEVEPYHWLWDQIIEVAPAGDPTFRVMTEADADFWRLPMANHAITTGYYNTTGWDEFKMATVERLNQRTTNPVANNNRLWGVRYTTLPIAFEEKEGFDDAVQQARLVSSDPHLLYEVEGGLRTFLASEYVVESDDEVALGTLMAPEFDPAQTVILDHEPDCNVSLEAGSGTAELGEYSGNRVTVHVDASGDGLLVLTDPWYPGWRARTDGKPTDIMRAYTVFRAVCVPQGEYDVTFEFRPRSWYTGGIVSILSWVGLGIVGLTHLIRHQRET